MARQVAGVAGGASLSHATHGYEPTREAVLAGASEKGEASA
jgi:hypothetical protein